MLWLRVVRFVVIIFILAAGILVGIIATLPFIVSTDTIRIRLAQEISAWTGYSVELRQPPRLTVFPTFRASLSDVILSKFNAERQEPLMSAERIDVELSLLDALMGHISFSETKLIAPRFRLVEPVNDLPQLIAAIAASQGRLGFIIRDAQKSLISDPSNSDTRRLVSQPFGRIVIENGSLSFRRYGSIIEENISSINGTFDWPQTSSPANFSGYANWHDEGMEINFSADQTLLLLTNGTSHVVARIQSKPLTLFFDGMVNISPSMFFEGTLTASSSSLVDTLQWVGNPPVSNSTMVGGLTLKAAVTMTATRIKFNDLTLTTDDNPAKGVIEIGLEQAVPAITGTLAFQSLDLRTLVSIFLSLPDSGVNDKIDPHFMNQFDLDLRLSAQNAKAGPASLSGLAAAIQVRANRAIFDIGEAKAFNGSLQANIQIIKDHNGTIGELRFNCTNIDSANLASIYGTKTPFLIGNGSASLFLRSPFEKWSSLFESVNGNITLTFGKGEMQGFDLKDFIAKTKMNHFFALNRKENVSLSFNRLAVKADIKDGMATLEMARIETNNSIVTLTGIVPFPNYSLALSGQIEFPIMQDTNVNSHAAMTQTIQPLNFFVAGSWDRPFISPINTSSRKN